MPRRVIEALLVLGILLASGLTIALPAAGAMGVGAEGSSTVVVSMPNGAGSGPSAAPGYSPDTVNVVIGVNNTVMWTNNDTSNGGTDHTVTSVSVPSGAASFDSGIMAEGATFTQTFTVPGTYTYHCTIHSWMTGSVVVLAASTSTTKTTPEFPSVPIALILFAVIAAVVVAFPRFRSSIPAGTASASRKRVF
jgi:plastocyanin